MKVLVTGFEPFGPWQRNPSGETVQHLDGVTIVDVEITSFLGGSLGMEKGRSRWSSLTSNDPICLDHKALNYAFSSLKSRSAFR